MKKTKYVLDKTHFRYLSRKQIKDIYPCINDFFGHNRRIEDFRMEIYDLFRASCAYDVLPHYKPYAYNHQQYIRLLEIGYVLKMNLDNFVLDINHALYRTDGNCFGLYIVQKKVLSMPALNFRVLSANEINNISIFFEDHFSFKSLKRWRETLDDILINAYENHNFDEVHAQDSIVLWEYMEKLIEAVYLVYETKIKSS